MSEHMIENAQRMIKENFDLNTVEMNDYHRNRIFKENNMIFYFCIDSHAVGAVAIYEFEDGIFVYAVDRLYTAKDNYTIKRDVLAEQLLRLNYVYALTL